MEYRKGKRVRHPAKPDWGLGEVLEDSRGDKVRLFFVGAGEKTLSLSYVQLEPVTDEEAAHPLLDNLKTTSSDTAIRYQSVPQSIDYFLKHYTDGFYGQRFVREERDYKVQAHQLATELLGRDRFHALLDRGDASEICKGALKIVNATNLIFPNEKMALKDGLKTAEQEDSFARALFDLLYGEGEIQPRFEIFCSVLYEVGAGKWPVASYFPFICHPERFMFVKPTITQHVAALCGFEINYQPRLNWLTYHSVLELAQYLKSEITELHPRDMIDVQSFMWCIAPH